MGVPTCIKETEKVNYVINVKKISDVYFKNVKNTGKTEPKNH